MVCPGRCFAFACLMVTGLMLGCVIATSSARAAWQGALWWWRCCDMVTCASWSVLPSRTALFFQLPAAGVPPPRWVPCVLMTALTGWAPLGAGALPVPQALRVVLELTTECSLWAHVWWEMLGNAVGRCMGQDKVKGPFVCGRDTWAALWDIPSQAWGPRCSWTARSC